MIESAETANSAPHIDVEKPYILRNISLIIPLSNPYPWLGNLLEGPHSQSIPNGARPFTPHMPGNFSLLALAILLMDLSTGQSFEMQQKKTSGQSAEDPRSANTAGVEDEAVTRLLTLSKVSKWMIDI